MTESWCPRVLPFTAALLPFSYLFPPFPVSFPYFPASFPGSQFLRECPVGYFPSLLQSSVICLSSPPPIWSSGTSPTSQSLALPHSLSPLVFCFRPIRSCHFFTPSHLPLRPHCFGVSYSFHLWSISSFPPASSPRISCHLIFSSAVEATFLHLFHPRLSPWVLWERSRCQMPEVGLGVEGESQPLALTNHCFPHQGPWPRTPGPS